MAEVRRPIEAEIRRPIDNESRQPVDVTIRRPVDYVAAVRRISWGAALAGVAIALVTQLGLSLLGVGIGVSTIDPLTGDTPRAATFGMAAGLWWIVSWCIALWLGGWAAGHLAGMPRRQDATLHGVLTWAFTTLLLFYLLTTAIGSLIGGGFRTLGPLLSASGKGAAAAVSGLDVPWDNIQRELATSLRQTGKAPLQPEALRETARDATGQSGESNQDLTGMLDRLIRQGKDAIAAADRDAVINVMVARTGMSREQAAQTLQRWEVGYQKARAEIEQKALQAADTAAKTLSQVALWAVVALVLGGIAAALGGACGTPRDLSATVVRET
jgi:hypothetical protein